MFDIFNSGYAPFQIVNIAIHVGFGSMTILLGLAQLFTRKGGRVHAWIGRVYLGLFCVVLTTALTGTFSFGFWSFLAALTLSSGYWLI